MSKRFTIHDIAERAGVSRGTVSRVLNNHPAVKETTRRKVLDVMEQVNYRPSFSARHMRTDNSNLVGFGLISHDVITSPHAVDMIRGAQEALWNIGKVMLVINSASNSDMTQTAFEAMLERRVEGIVYGSVFHQPIDLPFDSVDTPIVLANCYARNREYPSVVPDEFAGGYNATKVLLEKDHKRIGFINLGISRSGSLPPQDATKGRLAGHKHALKEFGVPFEEELVRYTDFETQTNFNLTKELMQLGNPPTAIFCGTDRIAMGCYGALQSMGLNIPNDVAVVGFDNQQDIGIGLLPNLTTIQLPHYEMGRWAVEYLMENKDNAVEPVQHKLDCPVVRRDSV
ncbi:MAG: LacI family DNA-binding transcriptional regulator [Aggregatilineales bacterium]